MSSGGILLQRTHSSWSIQHGWTAKVVIKLPIFEWHLLAQNRENTADWTVLSQSIIACTLFKNEKELYSFFLVSWTKNLKPSMWILNVIIVQRALSQRLTFSAFDETNRRVFSSRIINDEKKARYYMYKQKQQNSSWIKHSKFDCLHLQGSIYFYKNTLSFNT